jgi:hypothetical protein
MSSFRFRRHRDVLNNEEWRRLRRDLNSRWWYCPRLGESLQQVVRGLSRSLA